MDSVNMGIEAQGLGLDAAGGGFVWGCGLSMRSVHGSNLDPPCQCQLSWA